MKYKLYLVLALLLASSSSSAKAQPIIFYSKRIVKKNRKYSKQEFDINRYLIKEKHIKVSKEKNVTSDKRKRKNIKKN